MSFRILMIFPLALALLSMPAYAEELAESDEGFAEEQDVEVDESCEVEAADGGIHCVRSDGEVSWEIHHPSLWDEVEDYLARAEERFPVGPIEREGRVFYGVRGDLIEVDPEQGRVVGRRRMVAPIESLEFAEDEEHLKLVLHFEPDVPGADAVKVDLQLGVDAQVPAQNVWFGINTFHGRMTTSRDSDWLVERLENEESPSIVEELSAAYERDPLNLFLLARLTSEEHVETFLELEEGSDGLADAVSRQWNEVLQESSLAAEPPWQDYIAVSWILEGDSLGRDIGGDVFDVGLRKMLETGIEPERMTNLVSFVIANMWLREGIVEAVEQQDAQRVDDLSNRIYLAFPHVEGGEYAWPGLADWLEAHGESGERWRERARENAERSYSLAGSDSRAADRLIAIQGGLSLALLLFPLLIGIQGGRARRRQREGHEEGAPSWVPLLGFRHLLGLLLLLGAMVFCVFSMSTHVTVVGKMAQAPINVADDTLASPDVRLWLEDFAPSPARDELLEISNNEWEALLAGQRVEEKPAVVHLVHEAVTADVRATQWELLKSGRLTNPLTTLEVDADGAGAGLDKIPVLGFVPFLGLLAFLIFVGTLLGGALPRVSLWILRLVPGGAPALVPIGGLLLGGLFAALAAFMGADNILTSLAVPAFPKYFGLQDIASVEIASPSRLWAWMALGAAVLFQAAAVGLELRRSDSDSAAD